MDEGKVNPDWLEYCNSLEGALGSNEQNEDVFGFPEDVKQESDTLSAFNGMVNFYITV